MTAFLSAADVISTDSTRASPSHSANERPSQLPAAGETDDGDPLPKRMRPLCGTQTRTGGRCKVRVEPGKLRCRFHGGMSTGPKTAEGRARIAEAQRRRWAAWRNYRHECRSIKSQETRQMVNALARLVRETID